MDVRTALLDWAWQRHHNELSWYIRPLFLIPLAWFAHRRSGWGIAGTIVAMVTSMAWFPAPAEPSPEVLEFLRFEQDWFAGSWTAGKVLLTALVPASLAAYCLAFWRRSIGWGIVVLNAMAIGKIAWGVGAGDGTGWAMLAPAAAGLLVGDVVLLAAAHHLRRHRHRPVRPA